MRKFFVLSVFLVLFIFITLNCSANSSTETMKTIFNLNSTLTGKKFKSGMLDNYYKVCTLGSNSDVEKIDNAYVMNLSDVIDISNWNDYIVPKGFTVNYSCNVEQFVAFSNGTTRGYEYLLMYGADLVDDSETNSREGQTLFPSVIGNTNLVSSDIKKVNGTISLYVEPGHTKAIVALYGDVVYGKVVCKQFHNFFGEHQLWSCDTTAYYVSNIRTELLYLD